VKNEFPDVHLIKGSGQMFWNRGMHKSFSAAICGGYEYYVWLNDDSILYKDALQILLSTHLQLKNEDHECSIIGGSMQDPVTREFTYGGLKRIRTKWGRMKLERVIPTSKPTQCEASNGNCVFIPASVVSKVGNLDPVYLHRWGDHDYCFRALQQGCTVWVAPGYLGTCRTNPVEGTWEDINVPIIDRFRKLNSPHGFQFHDYAIYLRRHRGGLWLGHLLWPYFRILLQSVMR
jgi:GT2 family glycosyltransferase